MLTNFKVITITHHYVDVSDIENYVVKEKDDVTIPEVLHKTRATLDIKELVYLSTCNRVTYILYTPKEINFEYLQEFFSITSPETDKRLIGYDQIGVYDGLEAIRHILEVSGSIDSMVVGEREIFRQMREAFNFSKDHQLTGDNMRLLEKMIVSTSKYIYANTRIGEKPLSIASLAVENLLAIGATTDQKAIMIGAGETNTLVGKFMIKHGFKNIDVYNRSLPNAEKLCDIVGGKPYLISQMNGQANEADIIFVCTASTSAVLTKDLYDKISHDDGKQRMIVDLSVPANVSAEVASMTNVKYIPLDELKTLASKNLEFRRREISIAKKIVTKKLIEFRTTFEQRKLEIALKDVPEEIKAIKSKAIEKVYAHRIEELDEKSKVLLLEMMNYMEKKCISIPMKAAKNILK